MKRSLVIIFGILVLSCFTFGQNPEPAGWFAGDMHVHRSCGGAPVPVSTIHDKMNDQNLAAVSLLADIGNGEVQDPATDIPKVNGADDPASTAGRIIHWDAEWHWDATYTQYPHQALGGHIVALGLTEAHQIWQESTAPILDWAHAQNAIAGFAHMQYLGSGFPTTLTCCTPVEYPVEVALGSADFISEDVNGSETAIQAYYRLLNSGLRPGFAAGTDYPCNDGVTIGTPMTYARTASGQMTYREWIDAIASGHTVVSRNGHNEFVNLLVNGTAGPGDQISLTSAGTVNVSAQWTASANLSGTIEIVSNGVVVASKSASLAPGGSSTLTATLNFPKSGWIAARRMDTGGHVIHTAAMFVIVNGAPVRVNSTDPQFYVDWMNNLLTNTAPGGIWNSYYPTSLATAQSRYQGAKALFQQIAAEAQGTAPALSSIAITATNTTIAAGASEPLIATATYADGSTVNVTSLVAWSSSDPSVARVSVHGLVFGVDNGTTGVSATLNGISGSVAITVQTAPVVIATTSLPGSIANAAYSATLTATGGVPPYVWSVASGALPPGVFLNSAGVISGAPTITGTYGFTVQAVDSAKIPVTATQSLSIVVGAGKTCPCTIWPSTQLPSIADSGPDSAVEVGVTFRADYDGNISAIRFYKGVGNTGTHVGNLWSSTGELLASATFTNESASGWQQVNLASPVAIKAGSAYVASYHTNVGHYADDQFYFGSTFDSAPLHALADGLSGGNGVYMYGGGSSFPSLTWHSSNYWVDVVYAPSGPDTTAPTVVSVSPAANSSGVDARTTVFATFSESLNAATINTTNFQLSDSSGTLIPATVSFDSGSSKATLTPTSTLSYSTTYNAVVKGGSITDLSGNVLASDFNWSFSTSAPPPPPPTVGPGGPILVVSSATNPFSTYYAEILRAEGFNEFAVMDVALVSSSTLQNYDVVIVGDFALTSAQATMFSDWVNGGGNLIATHPDKQLASMLGLVDAGATLKDSYLLINTGTVPGLGLINQTIQFHGNADLYSLSGATSLASLYSTASNPTSNPALTLNRFGAGLAAAFTYDLARSIIYTRQGNPAWSGQNRDGQAGPVRSDNLFFGDATGDPQPDYVDLNKVAIPQADEQQRLLANLILQMNQAKKPLPRFWYFPRALKAVVVMTGDDHGALYGSGNTAARFAQYNSLSPAGCSVADWQCIRATSYLLPPSTADNPLTNAQAATYSSLGFEIAFHGDSSPDCSDWTPTQLTSIYSTGISSFAAKYTSLPSPKTHRMHCVSWSDYDSQPQVELQNGIRMDNTYYYWPAAWINDRPGMFTGSGMPMRFTKRDGTMLDIYQAATQMTDESGQTFPSTVDALLDGALGTTGYYGAFTANMHNDQVDSAGADAIIASAQARNVPIISAAQLLTWMDGRNGSSFGSISWSGTVLTFTVSIASGANGLEAMLPANFGGGGLKSVTLNGASIPFTVQVIKGVMYAVFFPGTGTVQADYSGTPVILLNGVTLNPATITATSQSTGTITISDPAPAGGVVVTLSSNNAAVAAPAQNSVTVPQGSTTATFTVNSGLVTSATNVIITGALGSGTVSATLTVNPIPTASALALNPTSVQSAAQSIGTVTLSGAAPAGGALVTLTTTNSAVASPAQASLTIPQGATSATFVVNAGTVATTTSVSIGASYGGATASATLTVLPPPTASAVTLNPTSILSSAQSTGTVTLTSAAPTGGAVVSLSSSNPAVASPAQSTVTVSAGATTATFTVNAGTVAAPTNVSISATYGATVSATLSVLPIPTVNTIALNPTSVNAGNTSTATVTLTGAAPAGGTLVSLTTSNAVAASPAVSSITIPQGSTSGTFTVNTGFVTVVTTASISASFGGRTVSATLTVNPVPTTSNLTLNPTALVGGANSTATVTLSRAAPTGGAVVSLTSANTTAATVPASVTVAAGFTTATFAVTSKPVAAQTVVGISANYGGTTRSANLTVNPPAFTAISLTPTSVIGGTSSTGRVTLSGAAPTGGSTLSLRSSITTAAQVPASVTVAAGATSATFTVTTSPVTARALPSISATFGTTTRSATLTVNVPTLTSLTLSPTTVKGGTNSTGTVTLTGPAPAGGVIVALSDNRTQVTVPASVTIAAGSTSASFTIRTTTVTFNLSATISSVYGGLTRSATLTLTP